MELEYDTFGDRAAPPLLLVMGWATQMIAWDEEFCETLAGRGFHVIRFDNRDIGLSTKLDHLGLPDLGALVARERQPPYTLDDMASDAAGLLDALGVRAAHVVGASMGGYIAQLLAIRHSDRVLSLTSIMSGLGGADDVQATPEVTAALMSTPPADREGLIEYGVMTSRLVGSPVYFDEARARRARTRAVDRSVYPPGVLRQLGAIITAPSRREALGSLRIPALVIHGEADPLVPLENGRRTAAAIPGSKLVILPQMGHDLPPQLWPQIIDSITENAFPSPLAGEGQGGGRSAQRPPPELT
jgi:pimeloyl-ACP methyl ester carboxylesterase